MKHLFVSGVLYFTERVKDEIHKNSYLAEAVKQLFCTH